MSSERDYGHRHRHAPRQLIDASKLRKPATRPVVAPTPIVWHGIKTDLDNSTMTLNEWIASKEKA